MAEERGVEGGKKEIFWSAGNVLVLHLTSGYTDLFSL
jgi:hypothetical protein